MHERSSKYFIIIILWGELYIIIQSGSVACISTVALKSFSYMYLYFLFFFGKLFRWRLRASFAWPVVA